MPCLLSQWLRKSMCLWNILPLHCGQRQVLGWSFFMCCCQLAGVKPRASASLRLPGSLPRLPQSKGTPDQSSLFHRVISKPRRAAICCCPTDSLCHLSLHGSVLLLVVEDEEVDGAGTEVEDVAAVEEPDATVTTAAAAAAAAVVVVVEEELARALGLGKLTPAWMAKR